MRAYCAFALCFTPCFEGLRGVKKGVKTEVEREAFGRTGRPYRPHEDSVPAIAKIVSRARTLFAAIGLGLIGIFQLLSVSCVSIRWLGVGFSGHLLGGLSRERLKGAFEFALGFDQSCLDTRRGSSAEERAAFQASLEIEQLVRRCGEG